MIDAEDYDNEGYQKSLERLVLMSEKEYYTHLIDINRHQVTVARVLLWLSVVLVGFDVALIEWTYRKVESFHDVIPLLTGCYIAFVLSIISGVLTFSLSAYAIPAFGGYQPLYEKSWAEYAQRAHKNLADCHDSVYESTLTELLARADEACIVGNETNGKRGLLLRYASIATMTSSVLLGLGFIVFSFNYYL